MTSGAHDLGSGFEMRKFFFEGDLKGYTVTGPAAPQCTRGRTARCGGLCAIKPFTVPEGESKTRTYSIWQVSGDWPMLTFSPSVLCDPRCGDQYGFIRNGRWCQ